MKEKKGIKMRIFKDLIKQVKQGETKRGDAVKQIETAYFEHRIPHSVYHKFIGKLFC